MNNKMIPLSVPNLSLDILENVKETIETGWVSTGGRFIEEFQEKIAEYLKTPQAVALQSGTAGLHLALKVLGVQSGEEVIVPTLTFVAAVNPVKYLGAEPVFMDCDPNLNMDMDKLEVFLEKECSFTDGVLRNKKTDRMIRALIVVHVFGNPGNMEKLMELSEKYNLKIIEDATEALGSYYTQGKYQNRHCGTIGDIGVFSFNANKIITTGGGGMVVAKKKEHLEKIQYLGVQAKNDPLYFIHDEVGYNYRMTNIQAAFGSDQMDRLESFIETKQKNYQRYKKGIEKIPGLRLLPFREDTRANHWFYSIIVDEQAYGINRDQLLKYLNDESIQTRPLWSLIHKQKPYQNNQAYDVKQAPFYEKHLINIPCSSNLTEEQVDRVLEYLRKARP